MQAMAAWRNAEARSMSGDGEAVGDEAGGNELLLKQRVGDFMGAAVAEADVAVVFLESGLLVHFGSPGEDCGIGDSDEAVHGPTLDAQVAVTGED